MAVPPISGDPRFFEAAGPLALDVVAQAAGAEVAPGDAARLLRGVAPLQTADRDQVSFLDNRKYIPALVASRAGAVILHPDMLAHVPEGCVALATREPYVGWARVAALFHPPRPPRPGRHPSAVVDPQAVVADDVEIGAHAVIGARAEIGAGCRIGPGTVIDDGVVLGEACLVGAQCTISHALIGSRVRIFPGVRIGQDGFGFATVMGPAGPTFLTVPQLGRVVIGDDVEIGANTTIDRGSAQDTTIGAGSRLDNLVQIGHNVQIGRACVIVSQVGISGSAIIEDFVVMAGQVGVAGHVRVGRAARVGGQAGVMADIPAGEEYVGSPAQPAKQFFREVLSLRKMIAERNAARAVAQTGRINKAAPDASASGPSGEAGSD